MKDELNFYEKVHEIAKLVPVGRVTTYGAIAKFLGTASSARMVGWAMNAAHADSSIPAHRVVNRLGILTGKHHFAAPTLMEDLLVSEGIEIIDNQIQDFNIIFWDPNLELK